MFDNIVNVSQIFNNNAWLADFYAINDTTGAESENEAEAELDHDTHICTNNSVSANNESKIVAESGDNEADENTGTGDVTSGDIGVKITDKTQANGVLVEISNDNSSEQTSPLNFSAIAMNDTTGADSENETGAEVDNNMRIKTSNTADLINDAYVKADTGDNSASENTANASIDTGTATATIAFENTLNMAVNTLTIDPGAGTIEVYNQNTGHGSENEAETKVDNDINLWNMNQASVANDADVKLNTGKNEADENTGNVTVDTGQAQSNVNIINGGGSNNNSTAINIDLSALSLTAANATTGADSENEAEAKFENDISVGNKNSNLISNDVDVCNNTGENSASENTGTASLNTGNAISNVNIENQVNANQTLINYAPTVDISSMNQTTGAGSENEAKASVSNEIKVNNENNVSIVNDILIPVEIQQMKIPAAATLVPAMQPYLLVLPTRQMATLPRSDNKIFSEGDSPSRPTRGSPIPKFKW
jgi:hypothetical protein